MTIEKINELEVMIQQTELNYQALAEQKRQEILAARQAADETITALQMEVNALALAIKLADFPKKLIKSHKTCTVCGLEMRPFRVADAEGNVKKFWACQSADPSHDATAVR